MKNKIVFPKETKQMRKFYLFLLTSLVLFILLVTGCVSLNKQNIPITETPTLTFTISPQPINTLPHPSATISDPTATPLYPQFLDPITILVTQMPVQVSTVRPEREEYLYQNALVTLRSSSSNGVVFLNLDNISESDQQNSDFLIYIDTGSIGTTFELYPTNFARHYYSDEDTMDFASCMENFPKNSEEEFAQYDNFPIELAIGSGNSYCILTNEGRLAVVNLVIPSNLNYQDDQGNLSLPLVVTVYNRIVTELFTPPPTKTTGPSPTATNRYSERNISDPNQIKMLDASIQAFIDAIAIGDKEAIANMISYPLYVRLPATEEDIQLNNQTDFLMNYNEIFPKEYTYEIAKATIENNI